MPTNAITALNSHDGQLCAQVSAEGGILTSLRYRPVSGQTHAIFYRAHWLDDPQACADQPPLMRRLAGEWVGVPFGHAPSDGDGYYRHASHGLPVNGLWEKELARPDHIQLGFRFPDEHPIARLQRTITLVDDGVALFSLTLEARRACRFPIGLHPIFPVGGAAGGVELHVENLRRGLVYPQSTEPGVSRLAPLASFTDLSAVPALDGSAVDLSRLPLPYPTEEIVQLLSPVSGIVLRYPTRRLRVALNWDSEWLPHCLLWFSNGGRAMAPWNGKNHCLGVEPICSAWDLGPGSTQDNPISALGQRTSLPLTPGRPVTIRYRIGCRDESAAGQ